MDRDGFARDAWGTEGNRIRYAVHGDSIAGVDRALTRSNGLQLAGLAALAAAPHYLYVCATAGGAGCGAAANQLTRRAAFVLLSTGANGALAPAPGSDEARNLDADNSFVAREPGPDFDDVLHWGAIHALVNRMVVAGRLP